MANRINRKNSIYFRALIAVTVLEIFLMAVIYWRIRFPIEPEYYQLTGVDSQGHLQRLSLSAQSSRLLPNDALLTWAETSVAQAYTFNGLNYQENFDTLLSHNFTSEGAASFRKILDSSQLLKQVTSQQLNLTGIVSGQPVILKQGALMGRYTWKVQMPLLLTFESASQVTTKRLIITVLIVNVPTTDSPEAVAIDEFWSTG